MLLRLQKGRISMSLTGTECIFIILLVRFVQQYCSKSSSLLLPKTLYGNTKYFMLTKLLAAVFAAVLLVTEGGIHRVDLPTVLISAGSGVMLVVSSVCGLYAIKSGTMALSSMFATAGLIVPCVAGIFLYDEQMSLWQWGGVALFLASSYLLIGASKKMYASFSVKTLLLLVGSMLSNGVTMMLQTVFKRTVTGGSVTAFSFFSFILPALLLLVLMGAFRLQKPSECSEKLQKKLVVFAFISAAALFAVNQLATLAADKVEPVVLFTFINGGNTLIAAVIAAVFFKEKITLKSACGLVLGVAALVVVKAL